PSATASQFFLPLFPLTRPPPSSTLFPYTTLFRSDQIADPLNKTCAEQFPRLDERLVALEAVFRDRGAKPAPDAASIVSDDAIDRSEEHTSELQSRSDLVCRLLLEKKKKKKNNQKR